MARAVVVTSVLFAGSYRRDAHHEVARPILHGFDDGSLPEAVVLDYVLAETLNGLNEHAGHDAAVDLLDRIEENRRFHIETITTDAFAAGKALFRRHEPLSFVDACIATYMKRDELTYLYAFDGDFDAIDAISRIDTAVNPFDPD